MDAASLSAAVHALAAALNALPAPAPGGTTPLDVLALDALRAQAAQLQRFVPHPPPPTRHPRIYLPDGNIAIATPATGGAQTIVFRVHQSVLARQSPVFAEMFPPPTPMPESANVYDGVPITYMSDAAEDVEALLTVLYDPAALPHARGLPDTPDRVRGVLALATKYNAAALRTRIVAHFAADWPTDLVAWDARRRDEATLADALAETLPDEYALGTLEPCLIDRVPEPAAAVRLARACGVPSVLPAAFYALACSTTGDDWDAVRADAARHVDGARGVRWGLLTADDLRVLFAFRKRMRAFVVAASEKLRTAPSCADRGDCEALIALARSHLLDGTDPLTLMGYDNDEDNSIWNDGIACEVCQHSCDTHLCRLREELWGKLEEFLA